MSAAKTTGRNMIEAINDAHRVMMERDEDIVVFGEDVGFFGGVFRATAGLQKQFGKTRCFDAPISEGGIVGTAVVFSWLVSGLITPYLAVKMLPDFKQHGAHGNAYQTPFYRKLRAWIDFAMARRWWCRSGCHTSTWPGRSSVRPACRARCSMRCRWQPSPSPRHWT